MIWVHGRSASRPTDRPAGMHYFFYTVVLNAPLSASREQSNCTWTRYRSWWPPVLHALPRSLPSNYARSVWHDCGQFPRTYLCLLLFAWGFVSYLSSAPWPNNRFSPPPGFYALSFIRSFVCDLRMEKVCMDVIVRCLVIFIRQPSLGTSRSNG